MKASDLLVACLQAEGVKTVFGVPGEENLAVVDSLRRSDIELVVTRHEQAAGFMAATHGRLTGQPGVCLATLGPGATNLVTAAAYANLGAMPMVMLTGQKPIKTSKQGRFQIVDIVQMMEPLTKSASQVVSGARLPAQVREAFRLAREERPGATHLELPEDVAAETVSAPVLSASEVRRPTADVPSIEKAAEVLRESKRPLLLIGAGANRKRVARALSELVERVKLPFVTTQMGKGVVSDDHPQAIGCCAVSEGDFPHRAIANADVILNVGHDVVEKPPFFMDPDGATVIHVNFTSAEVDPVYFPQVEVVGDIGDSISRIGDALGRGRAGDADLFGRAREAMRRSAGEGADAPGFPLDVRRVVADVRAAMPDDGIVALDNGMYKIWFARNYPARQPNTVLLDNALATMGAGFPSAMAAKRAYPERKVLAVCGDGGFMMNSAELETAVRLGLDVVVLVLRDDALGMIRWKQASDGFPDYGMGFGNPDLVRYAEAYGAKGQRVEAASELRGALRAALDTAGVQVIDVPIDYSNNDQLLNEQFRREAAALD